MKCGDGCSKCGGGPMDGPRYVSKTAGLYSRDGLMYVCRRCGYREIRPTVEQQKNAEKNDADVPAFLGRRPS